jgi:hypothetical protein
MPEQPRRFDPSTPPDLDGRSFSPPHYFSFSRTQRELDGSAEPPPVISEDTQEVLRNHLVLYVDELGTASSSRPDYSNSELNLDLAGYKSIRDYLTEYIYTPISVKTFSDNIIVAALAENLSGEVYKSVLLSRFMELAIKIQIEGCMNNRFYRGSIAQGSLYIDNDFVIGPALISAVRAEERLAVYPRVLVPADLLTEEAVKVLSRCASLSDDIGVMKDLADGLLFVDYLGFFNACDPPTGELIMSRNMTDMFAITHRNIILFNMKQSQQNQHVYEKYEWLAYYHNFSLRHAATIDRDWDVADILVKTVAQTESERFLLMRPV